jgi:uncharacterized repeat protein (TIGR02543 family)
MNKKIVVFVLIIIVLTCLLASCDLNKDYSIRGMENYFEYEDWMCLQSSSDVVSIMGITETGQLKEELVIPKKINGCRIFLGKSIGGNYWESDNLKKLFIPAGIKVYRSRFFEYCPALEKLVFLSIRPEDYKSGFDIGNTYGGGFNICIYDEEMTEFLDYTSYDPYYIFSCNLIFEYNYLESINNGIYWLDHLEEGEMIKTMPSEPIREDYIFDGWYAEKECVNKIELSEIIMGTEPITVYAGWKQ